MATHKHEVIKELAFIKESLTAISNKKLEEASHVCKSIEKVAALEA